MFGRRRRYPYGLLVPVARVASAAAAEEVRAFLGGRGIRSTAAPCDGRSRWRLQVLVFARDAGRARLLVNEWTLPAGEHPRGR